MANVALVGCAHIHTPGFVKKLAGRADTRVKYVWDPEKARAEKFTEDLNNRTDSAGIITEAPAEMWAKVVTSLGKVWSDPEIAAVIVCSQTKLHKKLVLAAAAAKKHLFVEKPLGMSDKDSALMAAAVEQAGVLFSTGYFMRSDPRHLFLKDQIAKGSFGKITRIRGSNCHSGALGGWFDSKALEKVFDDWRWMADPTIAGCGAFGNLGTHSLDILMWLMGDVAAVTAKIDNGTARYPGCDELGEALIQFKSGVIGTLAAGWDDVTNPVSLIVSGTEGHAAIIDGKVFFTCKKLADAGDALAKGDQPYTNLPQPLAHPLDQFLSAVNGAQGLPLVTVREAAARSSVMTAMYRAAEKGKWVAPQ